jgi:hypothetical protein
VSLGRYRLGHDDATRCRMWCFLTSGLSPGVLAQTSTGNHGGPRTFSTARVRTTTWSGRLGGHRPPPCPTGWTSRSIALSHCGAGGATSGRWTVVVWYPPLLPFSEPLPVAPQAWFPLFCYVRDREAAVHHPTPPSGGIAVPKVVRFEGLVQDWGLFPASDLEAQVLVQCS